MDLLIDLMLKVVLGIALGVGLAVLGLGHLNAPEVLDTSVVSVSGLEMPVVEESPIVIEPEVSEEEVSLLELEAELANLKVASSSAIGNSSGPVNSFGFKDLPVSVKLGESVGFKLSALDLLGETVTNFQGKVRFSVNGDNGNYVSLPQDYQFVLADQGEHTFALALNFTKEGNYNLRVTDLGNLAIFGETIVHVSANASGVNAEGGLVLSSPLAGVYSENVQVVSGRAAAGAGVKVFDNDLEIGEVVADLNGRFSFTTKKLEDGNHLLYVALVNAIGTITEVSPPVSFSVDTVADSKIEVSFDPKGVVLPSSSVKVKVVSEGKLSSLEMVVEGVRTKLQYNVAGFYQGVFAAPVGFGSYEVKFDLVDELGNKSQVVGEEKLVVGSLDFETKVVPPNVENVVAVAGDRKVSLSWDAVVPSAAGLMNYRVYYGLAPNDLTEAVDTFSLANNWFVPNLINGQTYYFAVVAVDERTNVSDQFSNIVMAVPAQVVANVPGVDVLEGAAGGDALGEMKHDASESGPGVYGLILFSLVGGYFYRVGTRKKGAAVIEK